MNIENFENLGQKRCIFEWCFFSSYNRKFFLPLQPFHLFCIFARKIYLRSHNNFLICFATLLVPWSLMMFSYLHNIVCSLHQKLLEPWQIAMLFQNLKVYNSWLMNRFKKLFDQIMFTFRESSLHSPSENFTIKMTLLLKYLLILTFKTFTYGAIIGQHDV